MANRRSQNNEADLKNDVDRVGEQINGQGRSRANSDSSSRQARESANGPDYGGGDFGSTQAETPIVSHDKEIDETSSSRSTSSGATQDDASDERWSER